MDIEFRAWIKPLQVLSDVQELYRDGGAMVDDYEYALEPDAIELMQYTGLKDEQGVKLYDGDIYWKWGERCVCDFGQVIYEKQECLIFDGDFLIVGNKYQNPELLE